MYTINAHSAMWLVQPIASQTAKSNSCTRMAYEWNLTFLPWVEGLACRTILFTAVSHLVGGTESHLAPRHTRLLVSLQWVVVNEWHLPLKIMAAVHRIHLLYDWMSHGNSAYVFQLTPALTAATCIRLGVWIFASFEDVAGSGIHLHKGMFS